MARRHGRGILPNGLAMAQLAAHREQCTLDDPSPATGIAAGSVIYTLDGALPVEHLEVGDKIITRDQGAVRLRGIRARVIQCDPIRFSQRSVSHACPQVDTVVPPDQKILIRDWRAQAFYGTSTALFPAQALVDGCFAKQWHNVDMRVFDLVFDRPHIVYADGLELSVEQQHIHATV
ncbi:Hint domain-containing protein [Primorskyibacter sp. S187A]|uniref:Hint domain-containing protein n=1 Tax=Primorskyibacter sp. S187A TaxID=3415130 RepID=UPI003C7DEBC8